MKSGSRRCWVFRRSLRRFISSQIDYVNGILFDLEKSFWDERGKGARHRTNAVGRTYFKDRCFQSLKSAPLLDMVEIVEQPLKSDGIIRRMPAETDGRMLFLSVEGCAHRPVEERMASYGIHPFTCVVANQMIQAVEQVLDQPIELVGVKLEGGLCAVQLVLFDKRPFLEWRACYAHGTAAVPSKDSPSVCLLLFPEIGQNGTHLVSLRGDVKRQDLNLAQVQRNER